MTRRHRQRAQTFVIGALAMTTMLGALSMVIDAGVYFVLQRQLQNAADAAALAAVWYAPACSNSPDWVNAGCQTTAPPPPPPPTPPGKPCIPNDAPCFQATYEVLANNGVALSLCAGPNLPAGHIPVVVTAGPGLPLNIPQVSTYVVTLSCDAPHWFGRVFPSVALTMHIQVSAAAALGWLGPNGQLIGGPSQPTPTTPLVARLII